MFMRILFRLFAGCITYVTMIPLRENMTADSKALERIYHLAIIRDVTKD